MEKQLSQETLQVWDLASVSKFTESFADEYRHLIKVSSGVVFCEAEFPESSDSNKALNLDSVALSFNEEGIVWSYSQIRDSRRLPRQILFISDQEISSFEVDYDQQMRIRNVGATDSSTLFSTIYGLLDSEAAQSYLDEHSTRYAKVQSEAVSKKEKELAALASRIAIFKEDPVRHQIPLETTIEAYQKMLVKDLFTEKPHFPIPIIIPSRQTLKELIS